MASTIQVDKITDIGGNTMLESNGSGTFTSSLPAPTSGIAASAIDSGTIAAARLGSGTASSSTFLRGDQTYAAPDGGAYTFLSSNDLSSGVAEFIDRDFFTTYSTYKHFLLDCQFVVPDDGNNDMIFVFQDASGDVAGNIRAAAKSGRGNNSDESSMYGRNQTAASGGINIFESSRGSNNQGMNMLIELWQPISSDGDINMMWRGTGIQTGYYAFVTGGGMSESGTNATGFVIKRASGNLTQNVSGASYIKIYGLAAS